MGELSECVAMEQMTAEHSRCFRGRGRGGGGGGGGGGGEGKDSDYSLGCACWTVALRSGSKYRCSFHGVGGKRVRREGKRIAGGESGGTKGSEGELEAVGPSGAAHDFCRRTSGRS
eukprot:767474-Hanusia_phi.AAC.4